MLLDKKSEFSSAQDLAQSAGTYPSTKTLDTGAITQDVAIGEELFFYARLAQAFTSGGSATVDVQLRTSDSSTFASGNVTLWSLGATAYGSVPSEIKIRLPRGVKRYLRVEYVIGTAATTAGKMDANIAKNVDGVTNIGTKWSF